ncbi:MAG: helix-turn-helix transcriptional regulator [Lachnospiraceae bacterium]
MSALRGNIGFRQFNMFVHDLDRLCENEKSFMGEALLYLIGEVFGYNTATLSYYNPSGFVNVVSTGRLSTEAKVNYLDYFQKIDPYAPRIRKAYAQDPSMTTLRSSSLFETESNDYYIFLRRYGVWWTLSMPINGYTLSVYKLEGEDDFSFHEQEALQLLTTTIRSKYITQQEVNAQKASSSAQSALLDSLNVGMLCFDSNMRVRCCNQTAHDYLRRASNNESVQLGTEWLFSLINQQGTRYAGIHARCSLHYMNHQVTLEKINSKNNESSYYAITIYPEGRHAAIQDTLVSEYNLTERELEVARMLATGKSYQQVANALYISINTVRTHIKNIYKKTGITNQRTLVNLIR